MNSLDETGLNNGSVEEGICGGIEDLINGVVKDAGGSIAELLAKDFEEGLKVIANKGKSPTSE